MREGSLKNKDGNWKKKGIFGAKRYSKEDEFKSVKLQVKEIELKKKS